MLTATAWGSSCTFVGSSGIRFVLADIFASLAANWFRWGLREQQLCQIYSQFIAADQHPCCDNMGNTCIRKLREKSLLISSGPASRQKPATHACHGVWNNGDPRGPCPPLKNGIQIFWSLTLACTLNFAVIVALLHGVRLNFSGSVPSITLVITVACRAQLLIRWPCFLVKCPALSCLCRPGEVS